MSLGSKTAVDSILKAAHYGGPLEIYHIGPFARRISFATQQTRALNLVWALKRSGRIRERDEVVVIGGGLAGITAAASLAEMKCQVTLLERKDVALWQQRGTKHRVVHPNINHWPEKVAHPTTSLAIFDWFSGECASVIAGIYDSWKENYVDTNRVHFIGGVTAERHLAEEENRVSFLISPTKESKSYKAAIIAAGFAEEKFLSNYKCESYWNEDRLEDFRDEDSSRSFVVNGCGDGGLIDALRLAYKRKEFGGGKLAISVAETLDNKSRTSKIIRAAEKKAASLNDEEAAAFHLEAEYLRAAKALPSDLREMLVKALYEKRGVVTLLGREPTPYSLAAAPINKLLLTIAKNNGRIDYDPGHWDIDEQTFVGKFTGKVLKTIPSSAFKTVVRLGAPLVLEQKVGLISEDALKKLKANQFAIWDIVDAPHWRGAGKGTGGHPPYDPKSLRFIKARTSLTRRFVSSVRAGATVSPGENEFLLYTEDADPGPQLPNTAFGIAMREPDPEEMEVPSV